MAEEGITMISALAGKCRISRRVAHVLLVGSICVTTRNAKPRDCSRGQGRRGNQSHERKRRRIKPAMPTSPVPSKPIVPGSGTVGGGFTGVDDVVKQVAKPPFVGSI